MSQPTAKYKSLSKADSDCSLNSSSSSKPDPTQDTVLVIDDTGSDQQHIIQRVKKKSVYVFRCRYCKKTFTSRQHGTEGLCSKAPNFAKENVDKLFIVQGYRGLWYHMTKDELPYEENEDVNILRFDFPRRMGASLWIKYICISIFCFPCICLWFPFALWERHTRFIFGPRHSIRRKRKGADQLIKSQPTSTSEPPPQTITTTPLPVPVLLPTPEETSLTLEPSGHLQSPASPPPIPEFPPPSSEATEDVESDDECFEDERDDTDKVAMLS